MNDMMNRVGVDLIEETIDQLTGRSRKKWAVMLLAFVVGAALTAYLLRRRSQGRGTSVSDTASELADSVSDAVADTTA